VERTYTEKKNRNQDNMKTEFPKKISESALPQGALVGHNHIKSNLEMKEP